MDEDDVTGSASSATSPLVALVAAVPAARRPTSARVRSPSRRAAGSPRASAGGRRRRAGPPGPRRAPQRSQKDRLAGQPDELLGNLGAEPIPVSARKKDGGDERRRLLALLLGGQSADYGISAAGFADADDRPDRRYHRAVVEQVEATRIRWERIQLLIDLANGARRGLPARAWSDKTDRLFAKAGANGRGLRALQHLRRQPTGCRSPPGTLAAHRPTPVGADEPMPVTVDTGEPSIDRRPTARSSIGSGRSA